MFLRSFKSVLLKFILDVYLWILKCITFQSFKNISISPSFLSRLSSWILFNLCSSSLKLTLDLRGCDCWGWVVWGSNSPSLEVSESSRDLVWPRFTVSRYLVNKSVSLSEKSATTWSSLILLRLRDCRTLVKWPRFRGREEFVVVKTWLCPSRPSCWPLCCWPWPLKKRKSFPKLVFMDIYNWWAKRNDVKC